MNKIIKKFTFKVGDLIVDKVNGDSGLISDILKNHVKIMWGNKIQKISKWQLQNNIVIKKVFNILPRKTK
jgi:hypothetical protein